MYQGRVEPRAADKEREHPRQRSEAAAQQARTTSRTRRRTGVGLLAEHAKRAHDSREHRHPERSKRRVARIVQTLMATIAVSPEVHVVLPHLRDDHRRAEREQPGNAPPRAGRTRSRRAPAARDEQRQEHEVVGDDHRRLVEAADEDPERADDVHERRVVVKSVNGAVRLPLAELGVRPRTRRTGDCPRRSRAPGCPGDATTAHAKTSVARPPPPRRRRPRRSRPCGQPMRSSGRVSAASGRRAHP